MSFRRRHRWLRRLALGLAVAGIAAVNASMAYAKADDGSATAVYITGSSAAPVQGEESASKVPVAAASESPVRPDDRQSRFAHAAVASQSQVAAEDRWTFERGDALILGIGTLALALGLSLALGSTSRPRIAGL